MTALDDAELHEVDAPYKEGDPVIELAIYPDSTVKFTTRLSVANTVLAMTEVIQGLIIKGEEKFKAQEADVEPEPAPA